jgi:hypothetical protein
VRSALKANDRLANDELDTVLAIQITVAWAGEKGGEPARLGWWDTDVVDEAAGGDLFSRLLPRTATWAALELVRAAAIRKDAELRARLNDPDTATTLFHLGFRVDEQLRDRLRDHKRHGVDPKSVLGPHLATRDRFDPKAFEQYLGGLGKATAKVVPGARQITSKAATLSERVCALASALLPLADAYPLPFIRESA